MTGDEFKAALAKIKLTPTEAGRSGFFGTSLRQIMAWLAGEAPVHRSAARLLRVMIKYKISVEDVEKLDKK